jgi:hypothetical protein
VQLARDTNEHNKSQISGQEHHRYDVDQLPPDNDILSVKSIKYDMTSSAEVEDFPSVSVRRLHTTYYPPSCSINDHLSTLSLVL